MLKLFAKRFSRYSLNDINNQIRNVGVENDSIVTSKSGVLCYILTTSKSSPAYIFPQDVNVGFGYFRRVLNKGFFKGLVLYVALEVMKARLAPVMVSIPSIISDLSCKSAGVIYLLGTPGSTQSLVLFLDDGGGEQVLVYKIPLSDRSNISMLKELESFKRLPNVVRSNILDTSFYINTVGEKIGSYCAMKMPFVKGGTVNITSNMLNAIVLEYAGVTFKKSYKKLISEMANHFDRRELSDKDLLLFLDEVASRICLNEVVDVGVIHGDLSPWNILRGSDGKYVILDWEDSIEGFPVFVDIIHYRFNQAVMIEGTKLEFNQLLEVSCFDFLCSYKAKSDCFLFYLLYRLAFEVERNSDFTNSIKGMVNNV